MPKGFFITGTDTGVGKTIVAGVIIRAIRLQGLSVCGMKPIETGCKKLADVLIPADGMFLKHIAHMDEQINDISPYRFEAPASPMVAAEMEKKDIDIKAVKKHFDVFAGKYDAVVVEGIGGLLVPVKDCYMVSDLAASLGLPLIVVTSPSLGMINHTLLTVQSAINAGLEVAGIIINYRRPPEGTLAEKTNPEAIRKLSPAPLIGTMPYLEDLGKEAIDRAVAEKLNMGILRKYL